MGSRNGSAGTPDATDGPDVIRFDPRDFIVGPFSKCPKCGGDEFGVLSVDGDHYTRRCRNRESWFTMGSPLPAIKKKIIYIDQFAISNMMKVLNPSVKGHERTAGDPFWQELFEALDVACKLQLVICPDSDEHRRESLLSPFYKSLKRLYELLSHGSSFRDCEAIHQGQITVAAGAWVRAETPKFDFDPEKIIHPRPHGWQSRYVISVEANYDQFIEGMRVKRDEIHEGFARCFAAWQQQRSFIEWYSEGLQPTVGQYWRFILTGLNKGSKWTKGISGSTWENTSAEVSSVDPGLAVHFPGCGHSRS